VREAIAEKGGFRGPLPEVLFEIQGPDASKTIPRCHTDRSGRFGIARVPPGTYRFKATLNGFQSIMRTIVVSSKATKTDHIDIEMRVGV
jgi:Carboxypeptidase regulatory-like domain